MKKIILFPFNGNAIEAATVIEDINLVRETWEIIGFVDDDPQKKDRPFGAYKVIGGKEKILDYPEAMILAVPGRPENYKNRAEIIKLLNIPASKFATIIHPQARIGINCIIGHNTILMANVVLTANTRIGNHVVILPNTVISHDSVVGDYSLLGSNISISGHVTVKQNCYIGSGSKIIQEITIGEKSLLGLGSVVLKDTFPGAVVAGNPAKEIRKKQ
ncbi:MAG: NeuD/PglB/VioB family sugar acetyltransferase [Proteobacteria bacterium]|nr:NeuD/PglB/VioB family sugar acetyltransferase [Pseudomonadota bacterium]MBU1716404.1 NeuD/PglB/VioB family sugar acetyltransferase [Pseudomonadota bacterium]